jgi:hypothetical protein
MRARLAAIVITAGVPAAGANWTSYLESAVVTGRSHTHLILVHAKSPLDVFFSSVVGGVQKYSFSKSALSSIGVFQS